MERLTSPAEGYCEKYCPDYIMPGCDPEKCAHKNDVSMYEALKSIEGIVPFDRLLELAQADRDGRCVVLPCQSGDHAFALLDNQTHVWECEVEHAILDGWRKVFAIRPLGRSKDSYYAPFGAFGQSIFLTREEAEAALEAQKGAEHD